VLIVEILIVGEGVVVEGEVEDVVEEENG